MDENTDNPSVEVRLESMLDRALVDAARERIGQNERRPPSTRAKRFWLLSGGIARCALCGHAYSPHTAHHSDKIRPYYRCYTRFNSGLSECTNGRSTPAAPLEEVVWEAVRSLCSDPDRVLAQYDAHVERLRHSMRGDPDREMRDLAARLQKLDQKESYLLDVAADQSMPKERLRAKLAEFEEQREDIHKVLREARARQERVHNLRRDRELLHGRFAAMRSVDLRTLDSEGRRRVVQALKLRVDVDEQSNVRISGIFDADITEALPMSEAPTDRPYSRRFRHEIPPAHKGVVTLNSAGPCTS